jgi:general secretion pathway protein D
LGFGPPGADSTKFARGPAAAGGIGGGALQTSADRPHTPVNNLIEVITTSVAPQTWDEQGGPGMICEYDGLLIVNATSEVQSQVTELFDMLSTKLALRTSK